HRRRPGLRLLRTGLVLESLIPSILEQKVTTDAVQAPVVEPAIADPGQLPLRPRPSLQAVKGDEPRPGDSRTGDSRTVDLTAEDDTQALPRLDSLERKLKDLEQQFG
ncbi:hypothetical protein ABZ054_01980, partial [Streptomyces sp. NPDC006324]